MTELRVNAAQWNALSTKDQARVIKTLHEVGALPRQFSIVPDNNAAEGLLDDLLKPACRIACDAAAAVGAAACIGLKDPAAVAACLAVVEAGRKHCRKAC